MDWIERLNRVAEYIEDNLTNDIQMETLAKTAYCSVYEFSRMFSFAAGIIKLHFGKFGRLKIFRQAVIIMVKKKICPKNVILL